MFANKLSYNKTKKKEGYKMKKIWTMFLIVAMVFSFSACGGDASKKEIENTITSTPCTTAETTSHNATPSPKVTKKPTVKPKQTVTPKLTPKPTPKPTATPHVHKYGSWTTVKAPSCVAEGRREQICSCGLKNSEVLKKTEHKYSNGICSVCKAYDPNKKQEEIDAENKRYEFELAGIKGEIEAKTSLLNSRMRSNGISYLYDEWECERKISQLESTISNLQARYMYSTSQSEKMSLQRQIDSASDELVKFMVMKELIKDKNEINELYELIEIVEIEHAQNIQKINSKYS
jgi:hypothetical protein